jgi:hypothetical protein
MTNLEAIKQTVEIALNAINNILPEGYFAEKTYSSTNYGNSGYIFIKKVCPVNYIIDVAKIRISDHSATNAVRQATEIMIDLVRFNINELMTRIDRALNPDNYENVEIRTLTDYLMTSNFQIGKKPYTTLTEPTFLGEIVGKKGGLLHKYSWLKEDVRFEWRKKLN